MSRLGGGAENAAQATADGDDHADGVTEQMGELDLDPQLKERDGINFKSVFLWPLLLFPVTERGYHKASPCDNFSICREKNLHYNQLVVVSSDVFVATEQDRPFTMGTTTKFF